MSEIVAIAGAYLLGAVPFALLVGRIAGVDVRREGSGNPGAANTWRSAGRLAGLVALGLDALKGWLPVMLLAAFDGVRPCAPAAAGAAAILGHVFSPFLGFRGGKGVATSAGVIGALAPRLLVAPLAVFAVIFALRRRVSEASLAAASALVTAALLYRLLPSQGWPGTELLLLSAGITSLLFWTHRDNIGRIRKGEEPRLTD